MSNQGFRRWVGIGALASAVLLGGACSRGGESQLPEREGQPGGFPTTGGQFEGRANESQDLESFGQQPATGGSGQQQGQPMQDTLRRDVPLSPDQAQQLGQEEAAGAQGRQGGIGAPGYSTPQETGSPGTGVTGEDTADMDGTSAPGTRTEAGGMQPGAAQPQSDAPDSASQPSRGQ